MQTTRVEQKAFTYMAYMNNKQNQDSFTYIVDQYKSMGANHTYLGATTEWEETNGRFDPLGVHNINGNARVGLSIDELMNRADYLHSQGMAVTLRQQVTDFYVENGQEKFRNWNETNTNVGDKAAFFQQYTAYMVDLAKACQSKGVEAISIGNEMLHFTTNDTKGYWENLISQIRSVYSGKLTYAAFVTFNPNWKESEMTQIKWLDKIDYIGIDFYPQLTMSKNATYEDFVKALYGNNPQKFNWVDYLKNLAETTGKKIMFTEVGVPSFDGAGDMSQAFNHTNNSLPSDQKEQADWFKAVFSVMSSELGDKFMGTALWDGLSRSTSENNGNNNDFTVIDKQAENVVRTAYTDGELDGLTKTISGTYSGSFNNDTITGSSGADSVSGGRGSDTIDLKEGKDTVVINSKYDNTVDLRIEGNTFIVKSVDGTDRLTNVETVKFDNATIDISVFSSNADPMNVYRFYNTQTGTHFYSNNPTERNAVINDLNQFQYEGVGFKALANGEDNVYRFYNTKTNTHFYTINENEKTAIQQNLPDYVLEGVAYKASDTKIENSHELFRFYNSNTGTHFYTDNVSERDAVKLLGGFNYEGVAYYVG
jgi:hypothetical protein